MSHKPEPIIEVIVPHQSRWDLLARLLESLETQEPRPTVCVVDNASTDDSIQRLRERAGVRICASDTNLGFGRAINLGARSSDAEWIIFLNNDMIVEPGFVAAMLHALESKRCAVAAKQLRPDDGLIDSIGVVIDEGLNAFDAAHGEHSARALELATDIAGPSGGAAGFRRDDFLSVGGYDEAIFAYLEDVDLAIRFHAEGIPTVYCDTATVFHHHSATLGSGSAAKNEILGWSRGYLLWKYRRSLSMSAKLRGVLVDTVVYLGQLFVDRNLGSIRGRMKFHRNRKSYEASDIQQLPVVHISLGETLRRRARRR